MIERIESISQRELGMVILYEIQLQDVASLFIFEKKICFKNQRREITKTLYTYFFLIFFSHIFFLTFLLFFIYFQCEIWNILFLS